MFVGCERFKLGTPNGPGLPDLTDPTVMLRSTVGLQRRKEPAIDPQHLVPTCTSRCKNVVSWIGSGRFGQNALDIFGHIPNLGIHPTSRDLHILTNWLAPLISDWPSSIQFVVVGGLLAMLIMIRYTLFTAIGFVVGSITNRLAPYRRLQKSPFTRAQVKREIAHSLVTVSVFTLVVGAIVLMTQAGWTKIYMDPGDFGLIWFWIQIPLVLLIQDWYFYWIHRISHKPGIYERVHKTHHLSTNPSAFAAFAFHPIEAFLEIAIFLVLVLILPLSVQALLIVGAVSLVFNVYGHLGFEIMPRALAKSPIGYWMNKSAFHNQHHRTYKYNFGLYTTIWDRVHGTLHPHAERLYDQATTNPVTPSIETTQGETV